MEQRSNRQVSPLPIFLFAFFAVWTIWAAFLVRFPEALGGDGLRAGVRLLVWVGSAWVFVRIVEGPPVLAHLGFLHQARKGLICGLLVSVVLAPLLNIAKHGFAIPHFVCPTTMAAWLNPILTAPLAEEILFRGVVFRFLSKRKSVWTGLVISSVLFALCHLPYWWLSGAKSGANLWISLLEIAGVGALLCALFQWKRSLWTPLIYHGANNFISIAFIW